MQTTSEFGEIEDDGLGRTQPDQYEGSVDNPRFGYDRKGAKGKSKMILWKKSRTWKASWRRNLECSERYIQSGEQEKKEELQIDWSSSE